MKDPFSDNASVIGDDMLEHIVGARVNDAQFEQGVQYFLRFKQDELKGFARMRRPFFYNKFGNDLKNYGFDGRDDMIAAYHEALARI
jgi:hypothetical protein